MASELARSLIELLTSRGQTISVCESLTGGLLGSALTNVPGASAAFCGGVIAYTPELKSSLVGVPPHTISEFGVVSRQTAVAMAEGIRDVCGTDWGIATTGVAGPEAHGGQPPGTVWLAVAGSRPELGLVQLHLVPGDRTQVRRDSVRAAIALAVEALGIT